ncbi:MAG: hypothetical protein V3T84_03405 [Phycisphaerales bacterium]
MAKGALVDSLVKAGRTLVERFDEAGLGPSAALWLYRSETDNWVLVLATDEAQEHGVRAAYAQIQPVFREYESDLQPLKFDDITAVSPDEAIILAIGKILHAGPELSAIRLTNNYVNSFLIDDALVYRLLSPGETGGSEQKRTGAA